jgi:5-methylcytosine-specific restriction endonuclease McrA
VMSWRSRNPRKPALYMQRRRAKKNQNGIFEISNLELKRLYESPCAQCGNKQEITIDHIIPISRGGRHAIGNLQPLCKHCNSSKKDKLMVEWKVYRNISVA